VRREAAHSCSTCRTRGFDAGGYKRLSLWALTPEHAFAAVVYEVNDIPAGKHVDLMLSPPVESSLEIQDADGKPVVGAARRAEHPSTSQPARERAGRVVQAVGATTEATGRAQIVVAPGQGLRHAGRMRSMREAGVRRQMAKTPEWAEATCGSSPSPPSTS